MLLRLVPPGVVGVVGVCGVRGVSGSFNVVIGGQGVDLNLTLDCYGSETSWALLNESNEEIYVSGGYQDDTPGLVVEPWCLNDGCYTFNLLDSYGDGLFGGFWCGTDGSVSIIQNGEVLAELLLNHMDQSNLSIVAILEIMLQILQ